MAKKAILETEFRGDDAHFQRTLRRVKSGGEAMGKTFARAGAAFGAIGGGFALSKILRDSDRIGKLAKQYDLTAEAVQRLGFVSEQSGADIEQVAKSISRANLAAVEAEKGVKSYRESFEQLGIDTARFVELDGEAQFKAIADAVAEAEDKNRAYAAGQRIMGRSFRELLPMLKLGEAGITSLGRSVEVTSGESIAAIEELNDAMNKLATSGLAKVADGLGNIIDVGDKSLKGLQILAETAADAALAFVNDASDPDTTFLEEFRKLNDITFGQFRESAVEEAENARRGIEDVLGEIDTKLNLEIGRRDSFQLPALMDRHTTARGGIPLAGPAARAEQERNAFFREAKKRMADNSKSMEELQDILREALIF